LGKQSGSKCGKAGRIIDIGIDSCPGSWRAADRFVLIARVLKLTLLLCFKNPRTQDPKGGISVPTASYFVNCEPTIR